VKKMGNYLIVIASLFLFPMIVDAKVDFRLVCDGSSLLINDAVKCDLMAYDVGEEDLIVSFDGSIILEDMIIMKIGLGDGWSGSTAAGVINVNHAGASGTFKIFEFEVRMSEVGENQRLILLSSLKYNSGIEVENKEARINVGGTIENPDTAEYGVPLLLLFVGISFGIGLLYFIFQNKRVYRI